MLISIHATSDFLFSNYPIFVSHLNRNLLLLLLLLFLFFISTTDPGQQPFTFQVGLGKVIQGVL